MSRSRSSSPLELDPSTLAALQAHFAEREQAEATFAQLSQQADRDAWKPLTVKEFQQGFTEDWQMSQFWYSAAFAERFAHFVRAALPQEGVPTVAFISCPTSYVGYLSAFPPVEGDPRALLLEFDDRFALLSPPAEGDARPDFVHYDLNSPLAVPVELAGNVDLIVADPPFLNETTNRKLKQTVEHLLKPNGGRYVLLTSTSVTDVIQEVYSSPLGPMRKSAIEVEHEGGRLQNDFGVWQNWE